MAFQLYNSDTVTNFQRAYARMNRDPRFGAVAIYLGSMEIIADDKVGTAATDCVRRIWYSPRYFAERPVEMCMSALIHEVKHKWLNFIPRFERWAKKYLATHSKKELMHIFNRAQDYHINWMLKHLWDLPLGSGWLYKPEYNIDDHTTESIADILLQEKQESKDEQGDDSQSQGGDESDTNEDAPGDTPTDADAGKGDDIILAEEYDGDLDNDLTEEQLNDIEAKNQTDMANAVRSAAPFRKREDYDPDKDPFTKAAHDALYKARYPWTKEFDRYADTTVSRGAWTYYRPNHRMRTPQGIVFPGQSGKEAGTVVMCIDSSGSTDGPAVRYFMDEACRALQQAKFQRVVIIWCSDHVAHVEELTAEQAKTWRWDGVIRRRGWGTRFTPAFELVARKYADASLICYLTDGGVSATEMQKVEGLWATGCRRRPILWALIDEGHACTERFIVQANKMGLGKCTVLPTKDMQEAA